MIKKITRIEEDEVFKCDICPCDTDENNNCSQGYDVGECECGKHFCSHHTSRWGGPCNYTEDEMWCPECTSKGKGKQEMEDYLDRRYGKD